MRIVVYKLISLPSLRITKEQIGEFILNLRKWFGPVHLGFTLKGNNYIIFIDNKNNKILKEYFNNRPIGYIEDIILGYDGIKYKLNQTHHGFIEVLPKDIGVTLTPSNDWEKTLKIKRMK